MNEEKTISKTTTPHGFDTPHKFPNLREQEKSVLLRGLSDNLYPTGRAFYAPKGGNFDALKQSVNSIMAKFLVDIDQTFDSTFPDNDNFTESDADIWEYQLGIRNVPGLDLDFRRQNILIKLGYPNDVLSRTNLSFIQSQLDLYGFNLTVHENTPPYKSPIDLNDLTLIQNTHSDDSFHGNNFTHGGGGFQIIANSIDPNEIYSFGNETNLWSTFFISGPVLGEFANVDANRESEFRELIIKFKPLHTAAFIFINFI